MTADDDSPGADPSANRLDRLTAAMEAFLRWCDRTEGSDREAFLARHDDLRDLLEPMLDDEDLEHEPEPAPDTIALLPGRQVADYRLVRELGRGGMGVVFEAEQVSLRRRVALKLLHPHLAWSASSIERFRREATTAAGLRHPAIVPIHEVGEWRGLHFFSMEFVDGEPLSERVHKERLGVGNGTRAQQVAELVARVAEALHHAHQRDLVHRDVKPHNIMIGHDGSVRLLDFGLVKDVGVARESATGSFVGTPHYCSPEQVRGEELGPVSDVFSLGIVLYELQARRRPFDAETTQQVFLRIEAGDYEPLRRVAPSTPRDLETICHKALESDPAARYASAGAFAEDLQRFLRIEPIHARPPGAVQRAGKWLRRHRTRVALASLLLLLLVGVPIGIAVAKENERRIVEEQRAAVDQQRAAAESERRAADATAELGFRSVSQTLTVVDEQLEHLPDPPASHRDTVDGAVRMYEQFLALRANDPKRRLRVAFAMHQATYVYGRMGLYDAAMATTQRATAILVDVADDPRAALLRQRLEHRRIHLEEALRPEADEAAFLARIEPWRAAAAAADAEVGTVVELVDLLLMRSRRLADGGTTLPEAERTVRLGAAVLEHRTTTDRHLQRVALQSDALLGMVLQRQGRATEAEPVLERALAALRKAEPSPLLAGDTMLVTAALGKVQSQLRKLDAAEASLRRAISEAEPLLQQFPGAHALRRASIRSQVQLAVQLMTQRRSDEAIAVLDAVRLPEPPDDDWMDLSLRASVCQQRGAAQLLTITSKLPPGEGARRSTVARALLTEAVAHFDRLLTERPDLTQFCAELAATLSNLAAAHNELQDYAAAAACARRAITLRLELLKTRPDLRDNAVFLGIHHAQLAMALSFLGDRDGCLGAVEGAIAHHHGNAATLRMGAEAAMRCADAADVPAASVERCRSLAVHALTTVAAFAPQQLRAWLADGRFDVLRDRDDFRQLADRMQR
ncbi:MAG: protein kinase [Planctomycetota bacterium]